MTRPRIPTRVGAARFGDNLFRGYSVSSELAGKISHWELLALAVGHEELNPLDVPLLDDLVVCCVAADPRIWPLKVVRLISAYGHGTAGAVAGRYCTEGSPFGWRSCALAAFAFEQLGRFADIQAAVDEYRARGELIPGFGVPSRTADERVVALRSCVLRHERPSTEYWDLAHRVGDLLGPKTPLNIGGACGAILLDCGFSPAQVEALAPTLAEPNYLANAVEGAAQAPAILRTLPADCIEDRTPPPRLSPRAQRKSPR